MNTARLAAALVAATACTVVMAGTAAWAHTPYILPNTFNPERNQVTLQGALTEDDYFNPDIALNVPAYIETLPSGQQVSVTPAVKLKDMTVTEAPMTDSGTYRFSTGQFVGRTQTFAKVGGQWLMIRQPRPPRPQADGAAPARPLTPATAGRPPAQTQEEGPPNAIAEADVPADAPRMKSEGVMVVETYVSKGLPNDAAVKTTGQGFELKPGVHPNAVYVDQGFPFQLLVDGQPAANASVSVYRSGNIYDDRRIAVELKTDAKGMGKVVFAQPGVYLLTTHYPAAPRAPGEAPPPHTYTYSLTFEVTR